MLPKDIKTVLDIGLLESWQSTSQKFCLEKNNFVSWYTTVQCIPWEWKKFIRRKGNLPADNYGDFRHDVSVWTGFFTKLSQVKTKQIYDSLVWESFIPSTTKKKLLEKFKIGERLKIIGGGGGGGGHPAPPHPFILQNCVEGLICSLMPEENETFEHMFLDCTFNKSYGQI